MLTNAQMKANRYGKWAASHAAARRWRRNRQEREMSGFYTTLDNGRKVLCIDGPKARLHTLHQQWVRRHSATPTEIIKRDIPLDIAKFGWPEEHDEFLDALDHIQRSERKVVSYRVADYAAVPHASAEAHSIDLVLLGFRNARTESAAKYLLGRGYTDVPLPSREEPEVEDWPLD